MDFLVSSAFAVGLGLFTVLTLVVIEHVGPIERYSMRERVPGLMMNAVGTFLSIFMMYPIARLRESFGEGPMFAIPLWQWLEPLGWLGLGLQFLLLIVIADFLAYWRHRTEHKVLWRIHAVHHSPRELHAANDIGHPLQAFYSLMFIGLPLSIIQVDGPAIPFAVGMFVSMLSFYIHSPIELHFGPLRKVIVDNRFHRIHHSLEERHFDKNFGICLSIWDHMFGTAYEPGDEWPKVGLAEIPAPRTIGDYLAIPFRRKPRESDAPVTGPLSREA